MLRRQFFKAAIAAAGMAFVEGNLVSARTATDFYLPEEADPHERTFMQWPVNRSVHSDKLFLEMLQDSTARIANTIAEFEPVAMLMDRRFEKAARRKLSRRIEIWDIPTDDLWCRDSGPLFVMNAQRELAIAHIKFNGWGNKQVHSNDGRVAERVAKRLGIPLISSGVVGEAGGLESDGEGTLIAHESSWINRNRNSEPKTVITERLKAALGAKKIIWAPGVKGADITDYHIDALARFVRSGKILMQLPDKAVASDPWSIAAYESYEIFRRSRDAKGRQLQIVKLPEPSDIRNNEPDFVASYVNYYICNGAVIAPQFGDRVADAKAKSTLAALYPDREVVTLNVDPIGEIGGGIHCATQQQPKA